MATLGRSWEQLTTYSALSRHRNSCLHKKTEKPVMVQIPPNKQPHHVEYELL